MELPKPSLLGRFVRLALALLLANMAWALATGLNRMPRGDAPWTSWNLWLMVILVAVFSSWVANELFRKRWKLWPSVVFVSGAGVMAFGGWALAGSPLAWPLGAFLWTWSLAFAGLLGAALLLAVVLGTPGCEMRAYADLWARVRGGDPRTVACPGWVDRLDRVRLFGRW